jgi:hypothetical protein
LLIKRIPLRGLFGVSSKSLVGGADSSELFFHRFDRLLAARIVGGRDGRLDELHFAEDLEVAQLRVDFHGLDFAIVLQ